MLLIPRVLLIRVRGRGGAPQYGIYAAPPPPPPIAMRAPPEPPSVDLSLAVNYLPGCVCLGKTALLAAWLCLLDAYAAHPGLLGTVLGVLLDRLAAPRRIFDANSVLLGVCAAHVSYALQRHCPHAWVPPEACFYLLHAAWLAFACWALWAELARLRAAECAARSRLSARELPKLHLVAALMALVVFFPSPGEPLALRCGRYLGYACLCVVWVYGVAIARGRLHAPHDSGVRFAVYFSPALYAPWPLAALHPALALLLGLSALNLGPSALAAPPAARAGGESPSPYEPAGPAAQEPGESLEELERVFRLAQQARAGSGAPCV